MTYTIDMKALDLHMNNAIDMAVYQAMSRFEEKLPSELREVIFRICHASSHSAVEQFAAYANSQLRLIEIDYETQLRQKMMSPISYTFMQGVTKDD